MRILCLLKGPIHIKVISDQIIVRSPACQQSVRFLDSWSSSFFHDFWKISSSFLPSHTSPISKHLTTSLTSSISSQGLTTLHHEKVCTTYQRDSISKTCQPLKDLSSCAIHDPYSRSIHYPEKAPIIYRQDSISKTPDCPFNRSSSRLHFPQSRRLRQHNRKEALSMLKSYDDRSLRVNNLPLHCLPTLSTKGMLFPYLLAFYLPILLFVPTGIRNKQSNIFFFTIPMGFLLRYVFPYHEPYFQPRLCRYWENLFAILLTTTPLFTCLAMKEDGEVDMGITY